ncbi:hypothetical protein Baya_7888 [Bagarius yarrelli]|uniref:Uncharacterized protein n=1 Tax=Bagarius yarrelli TaxID=175774 RepID=A0A556U2L1_BAGYA|nr:hypothetical protein Baya_7888 [Bagarius yarrelli]
MGTREMYWSVGDEEGKLELKDTMAKCQVSWHTIFQVLLDTLENPGTAYADSLLQPFQIFLNTLGHPGTPTLETLEHPLQVLLDTSRTFCHTLCRFPATPFRGSPEHTGTS